MSRDDAVVLDVLNAARPRSSPQVSPSSNSAKRLSEGFREAHSAIPWKAIAGMRDRIIHGYDDVDLGEVWRTIESDLPPLMATLERLVPLKPS